MRELPGIQIVSVGRALPAKTVTNDDFAQVLETSDEWIFSRTGIHERRICVDESNADLAAAAARQAMDLAGVRPEEIAACVLCTFTPDHATPATACLVQARLGLPTDIPSFDLNAACTGFLYGLQVVRGLLLQSERRYALLIGSEVVSRLLDFDDRSTCVLFGDGAGAAVVALSETPYCSVLGSSGEADILWSAGPGAVPSRLHMDGGAVYRFAVDTVPRTVREVLDRAGVTVDDVDWFVPHQANRRIVEAAAKRLKTPLEKWYLNMDRYGNTSAASVPIALSEMAEQGLLKKGQKYLCLGFGAGLTWGGALLEW